MEVAGLADGFRLDGIGMDDGGQPSQAHPGRVG